MFGEDDSALFENVDPSELQEGPPIHPDEAPVAALPQGRAQAQGASPDGIGSSVPQDPNAIYIPTDDRSVSHPNMPVPGQYYPMQGFPVPEDTTPEAATQSAGLAALLVVGATGIGYALGGWKGAVAGFMLGGATANGYRAGRNYQSNEPNQKHEAMVSGVFALAGLGVGGYVAYKAYEGLAEGAAAADDDGGGED